MSNSFIHEKDSSKSRLFNSLFEVDLCCVRTTNATATGFIYEHEECYYLITNAHNITRMNDKGVRISKSAGYPIKIYTRVRMKHRDHPGAILASDEICIPLYDADDSNMPLWYMHPDKGYDIDVIAIRIEEKIQINDLVTLFPINKLDLE